MYTFMHRVDPSWLSEDTILKALKILYSVCITQCILKMQVFCIFYKANGYVNLKLKTNFSLYNPSY